MLFTSYQTQWDNDTMSNNKQTAIYVVLASAFVLGSSQVQAVNGNTFYGDGALFSVTVGIP